MIHTLSTELLRTMPLPQPGADSDKEQRGRVLVVGSSIRVPGAAILSGTAALRVGAGKLQLAVPRSLAIPLGVSLVEAGIVALEETEEGDPTGSVSDQLLKSANDADAVLIGPGVMDFMSCGALTKSLLGKSKSRFVLDAGALADLWSAPDAVRNRKDRVVITPHAGEMAAMLGMEKSEVEANAEETARKVAKHLRCIVALKGADTFIADPTGEVWKNVCGAVGLGTCGSGDVLAGIIAGLIARGTCPLHAALWGVYLHAQAGQRLSQTVGKLGFLAHEVVVEIPQTLERIEGQIKAIGGLQGQNQKP